MPIDRITIFATTLIARIDSKNKERGARKWCRERESIVTNSLVQHQKVNVSPPIPALDSAPRDKERGRLLRTVDC